MKTNRSEKIHSCLKFIQVSMFIFSTFGSLMIHARDFSYSTRKPASAPEEEVMTLPTFDKPLLVSLFAEDDAGIMATMRTSLNTWEEQENYSKRWNLESTGLYKTPTTSDKRKYIANKLLKYADKRLSGEIRNADEGSTLHSVGKVEKSLRPNAVVSLSKLVSVKFKARVLQGKAIMEVRNPWVEFSTTLAATGSVKLLTQKNFKELGTSTGVEFAANNSEWVAFVDQEVTTNVKARLSSTQKNQSIFNNDADKKVEMSASFPLNF